MTVVSEHAYELHGEPADLDRLADAAHSGEVIYLIRDGQRIAAMVSAEVATAGAGAIEALEDAEDIAAVRAARAARGPRVPHEQVLAELGLDETR